MQRQGMGSRAMESGDRKLSQALFRGAVAPFLQLEKDGKDEGKGRVWEGSEERWWGEAWDQRFKKQKSRKGGKAEAENRQRKKGRRSLPRKPGEVLAGEKSLERGTWGSSCRRA